MSVEAILKEWSTVYAISVMPLFKIYKSSLLEATATKWQELLQPQLRKISKPISS